MSGRAHFRALALSLLIAGSCLIFAQEKSKQELDREYQAAVAEFNSRQFDAAADRLEKLLPYATTSPEVHELLGLVYASQPHPDKAIEQLKTAVQLKPNWLEARSNLGTALLQAGQGGLAGEQFRKALALDPHSYDTNHNLGEYYVRAGKIAEGRPLLKQAYRLNPDAYDTGYDLAMADFLLGNLDEARAVVSDLIKLKDAGELHNLLGKIDEKQGKFIDAANDYQAAAHLDPSEENLFDWGSEMLLHRTYEPAISIFQEAGRRYPRSPRIMIGLGLALYSRGKYDDAVKSLLSAADLDPSDPRCYIFLSKAYDAAPQQADEVIQAFRRYAELKPDNALAQYYYAMSLWKGRRAEDANLDLNKIESLLKRAVILDDSLPEAHLQLGNLYANQHLYDKSIPQYLRAVELDPNLADAHYRLGTDYVHVGQKETAQKEFAIYQRLRAEHLSEVDKERAEVQQFVYSAKAPQAPSQ